MMCHWFCLITCALIIPCQALQNIDPLYAKTSSQESTTVYSSDNLRFGQQWPAIRARTQAGELNQLIIERKQEIANIKESWRPRILQMTTTDAHWHVRNQHFQNILSKGKLVACLSGGGSAYILFDSTNTPRYIVKPFDEDILCLNNRKKRASPFRETLFRVRSSIPLYQSAQREAAAAAVAAHLKIPDTTPWIILAIIRADAFYDISEALEDQYKSDFIRQVGPPDKEKLCSVQPFFPDAIEIGEAMHEWFEADQTSDNLLPLDQESYEDANLFVWTIYDCDGHGSNFLLYLHSLNNEGKALYGLKKIDNGLCFPNLNKYLINYLAYLPNAKIKISSALRKKIAQINIHTIAETLATYGLHQSMEATISRLTILKTLAQWPDMTIEEMNLRMELLALPEGNQLALTEGTREDLEELSMRKEPLHPPMRSR